MEKPNNEEIEIDVIEILCWLKLKLWIIILAAAVLSAAAGLISYFLITPMYSSTAKLYILSTSNTVTSLSDIQVGTQLTQDYIVLVKSRPVVNKVIEQLGLDQSYEQLANRIAVTNPSNTRIMEIHAEYPDAGMVKNIVDELAKVSSSHIARIMNTEEPTIAEEGYLPSRPSDPNVIKNAIIGGIMGIVLSAGAVIVLHMMDDTIKTPEDVEKYLGISTLALIPKLESGNLRMVEFNKPEIDSKYKEARKARGN